MIFTDSLNSLGCVTSCYNWIDAHAHPSWSLWPQGSAMIRKRAKEHMAPLWSPVRWPIWKQPNWILNTPNSSKYCICLNGCRGYNYFQVWKDAVSIRLRVATILFRSSPSVASIRGWPLSGMRRLLEQIQYTQNIWRFNTTAVTNVAYAVHLWVCSSKQYWRTVNSQWEDALIMLPPQSVDRFSVWWHCTDYCMDTADMYRVLMYMGWWHTRLGVSFDLQTHLYEWHKAGTWPWFDPILPGVT